MIECHTGDFRRIASSTELKELVTLRDAEYADYGPFVGGGGEDVAFGGEGEESYGSFVSGDDIYGGERQGIENENFAGVLEGCWGRGSMGGLERWRGGVRMGEDEITVLRRG